MINSLDLESNHEYLILGGIFSNISSDIEQITISFELSGTNTIDYISKGSSIGSGIMKNGGGINAFLVIETYSNIKVNLSTHIWYQGNYNLSNSIVSILLR